LFRPIMSDLISRAEGEIGVAVCGPLGLSTTCRMAAASLSGGRGTAGKGIYLHVEGFCW
jgi:ferric-chelate reductase